MLNAEPNSPDPNFLKTLLQPLLEDFQYWFGRSQSLLTTHRIDFLSPEQQQQLLARVERAQQEVSTAQMLFQATGGQVGIETSMLLPWHQLVTECWQVGIKFRMENPELLSVDSGSPERVNPSQPDQL
jgi:Protein of unknown function (DUF2605)